VKIDGILTWNNGLRTVAKRATAWLQAQPAGVICLQEMVQPHQLGGAGPVFVTTRWFEPAQRPGYSGGYPTTGKHGTANPARDAGRPGA
jgi:exonuclease III